MLKREIHVSTENSTEQNHFETNFISTGKYNFLSFVPVFLYEQFRKSANIFFLFIIILQQIPNVSPVGKSTTLIPFMVVLLLTAIKEIIEDYKRHANDKQVNNRTVEVFQDNQWTSVKWKDVIVGDIVKVINKQYFPADIVALSSSEPMSLCYIETANIDGETNLKVKQAVEVTSNILKEGDIPGRLNFQVECQLPNKNLYSFLGTIKINDNTVPLSLNQFFHRGAALRNTHWVIGCVVYAGHKSKLMMNANRAPLKMSKMDRTTNTQIWFLLLILILVSAVAAVGNIIWKSRNQKIWYMPKDALSGNVFMEFLTFIVVFNNLLPISLLITLEIVKFVQAQFINNDLEVYDSNSDTPALARTSNLNEELGQVKFIFSDKTGTLTKNIMLLKKCSIDGKVYSSRESCEEFKEEILKDVSNENVELFLTMMSICHTVIPERDSSASNGISYISSSPDETALVQAAELLGFVFKERSHDTVTVQKVDKLVEYKLLKILEFTSARKRMSIIMKDSLGRILLLCKGADNVVYERLAKGRNLADITEEHLDSFAKDGLRTLCFAYAILEAGFYEEWLEKCQLANNSIVAREEELEEVYNLIEKVFAFYFIQNHEANTLQNMTLIGCSAIEDKLQDGVPETLEKLVKADIKVWVLTGDKHETAINIGHSSKLLTEDMQLAVFDYSLHSECEDYLKEQLSQMQGNKSSSTALVITGKSLTHLLSKDLESDFLKIALMASVVMCCRVSPIQKADVVSLVKSNTEEITLAIGDGANDVSMIQAAHVGVGISGLEGLQAANSSDYSIAQFRFLQKLLLVHGVWNHNRIAKCILYCFYKNICLYMIQLWFAFSNGFSGQILFEKWTITMYNFITAFPPLALGLFEKTCKSETMLKYPALYSISQSAVNYNSKVFWCMMINAIYHSLILFFIPSMMLLNDTAFSDGKNGGFLFVGNFVYSYVVVAVCFKAATEMDTWTIFSHIAIWGSILSWFLVLMLYSNFWPVIPLGSDMFGQGQNVLSSPLFWFGLPITTVAVLIKDMVYKIFKKTFRKTIVEEVHEMEHMHKQIPEVKIEKIHQNLIKKARILTKVLTKPLTRRSLKNNKNDVIELHAQKSDISRHGFAFSQEESGILSQSQIVKAYEHSSDEL